MKKVSVLIYLLKDSHGNQVSVTIEDYCDNCQVCGLKGLDSELLYFEAEAYHLPSYFNDNGVTVKRVEMAFDFNELWDNN